MREPIPKGDGGNAAILVDVKGFMGILGVSRSQFYRLWKTGRFPAPAAKLGRSHRWRRVEIEDWIMNNLPSRLEWNWKSRSKS